MSMILIAAALTTAAAVVLLTYGVYVQHEAPRAMARSRLRIGTTGTGMAAASPLVDTLDVTPGDTAVDSLSDPLTIETIAVGGAAAGRRVIFAITYPVGGPVVTLLPRDTVTTNTAGQASVQVLVHPGSLPDSVVVTASMTRFDGSLLPGSPVTFVLEFLP